MTVNEGYVAPLDAVLATWAVENILHCELVVKNEPVLARSGVQAQVCEIEPFHERVIRVIRKEKHGARLKVENHVVHQRSREREQRSLGEPARAVDHVLDLVSFREVQGLGCCEINLDFAFAERHRREINAHVAVDLLLRVDEKQGLRREVLVAVGLIGVLLVHLD